MAEERGDEAHKPKLIHQVAAAGERIDEIKRRLLMGARISQSEILRDSNGKVVDGFVWRFEHHPLCTQKP